TAFLQSPRLSQKTHFSFAPATRQPNLQIGVYITEKTLEYAPITSVPTNSISEIVDACRGKVRVADNYNSNSEADLIRLAQGNNTDAFCLLAERHQRRIYSLAFHYCQNPQDAEDLSQEV